MRDERGSIAPMIVGFAFLVAVLVAVVVDASAAYLERQELDSTADGAALAATDGLQGEQVYTHGLGAEASIDPATAREYVATYLRSSGAVVRCPGLTSAVSTTMTSVVVRLACPVDLPLHVPGVVGRVNVTGTATSVVRISD